MVTIHYSQFFDKDTYLDNSRKVSSTMNVQYLGSLALLGFLERELGLTGMYPDSIDRVTRFSVALRNHLNEFPEAFYADAFETDEMGVAKDLINWRDDMVWLGWKQIYTPEQPERLKTLAAVEKHFCDRFFHYGVADRWQDVLESIPADLSSHGFKLFVYDDPDLVHPFFRKLFSKLSICIEYVNLNESITIGNNNLGLIKNLLLGQNPESRQLNNLSDDTTFAILNLPDNHFAADLLSDQIRQGFKPLIINGDNKILDHYLLAQGLPASGSELTNSNPLIIQLFKLVGVGLSEPINVYNLLSLLQSPYSPVPARLSSRLARLLIEKPGVDSPEWKETIRLYLEEVKANDPEGKKLKKHRETIELYLTFSAGSAIDVVRLKNVYSSLKGWADKRTLPVIYDHTPEERDQFAYLSKLAEALLTKISGKGDTLEAEELLKLVEGIYEPASFTNELIQAKSPDRIGSPAELLDNPDVIWWHDCYDTIIKAEHHTFLYCHEIEFLNQQGIEIYMPSNQIRMAYEKLKRGILSAQKQCILVVVEKHDGEETAVHPVVSELRSFFRNTVAVTIQKEGIGRLTGFPLNLNETEEIKLPEVKARWNINNPEKLSRRKTESASSIEKLIQYPFEWVITYQAKLNSGNSFTLPEIFTIKGKVAHAATEAILKMRNDDPQFQLTDQLITSNLIAKIKEEGLVFLLPEMRFEYEEMLRKYKTAIKSLISIIAENGLTVIGSEFPAANEITGIGHVEGFMDLVLEDQNQKKIIFDLKWTRSDKKYQTKLEEGKAIQLAVYYALLENKPKTAYFMFGSGKLYTQHDLVGENIIKIDAPIAYPEEAVLDKTCNSVNYRWQELAAGDIEIGDNAKVADLPYFTETETNNLIPLDYDKTKKVKYGDAYSGLELFKGNIK
jgi:hypothetical protein